MFQTKLFTITHFIALVALPLLATACQRAQAAQLNEATFIATEYAYFQEVHPLMRKEK